MKKLRLIFYFVLVLWIAAGSQAAVNHFFMDDKRIIEAFAGTNQDIEQSELELLADYGEKPLSRDEKEYIIACIADSIGLNRGYTTEEEKDEKKEILKTEVKGLDGDTCIQLLTLPEGTERKNYISVKLDIYKNQDSILTCKKRLEACAGKLGAGQYRSYMTFVSREAGKLSMKQKEDRVNKLLKKLQAVSVTENRDEELFTVYAYTGLVDEYIRAGGRKINLNAAITYDEQRDITYFYLATPVLNMDY